MVEKKTNKFEAVEIATDTRQAIVIDGKEYTLHEAVAELLNEVKEIRKVVG